MTVNGQGHLQGELNEALDSIRMTESRQRLKELISGHRGRNHTNDVKVIMIERGSRASTVIIN